MVGRPVLEPKSRDSVPRTVLQERKSKEVDGLRVIPSSDGTRGGNSATEEVNVAGRLCLDLDIRA